MDGEATWWKKLLVIFFGLSIVAIGLQPLRGPAGGVFKSLRSRTEALAAPLIELRNSSSARGAGSPVTKTLEMEPAERAKKTALPEKTVLPEKAAPAQDNLTKDDRKKLSNLINGL